MKRFAAPVRRARREHRDQRQGRCAGALLRRGAAPPMPPGRSTSSPAASRARSCRPRVLRALACERAGIDDWLFDECYQAVGDLAETIAHVLPPAGAASATSAWPSGSSSACCRCAACRPRSRPRASRAYWDELDAAGRFLLIKLIGGGFRVGVSKLLVQRALAAARRARRQAGRAAHDGLHRRHASRRAPARYAAARRAERRRRGRATAASRIPSSSPTSSTLPPSEFDARLGAARRLAGRMEVRRHPRAGRASAAAQVWIWSRGEELVTERFPEIVAAARGAARRHRARRRDRRLEGRPAPRPSPCCSSASAARR